MQVWYFSETAYPDLPPEETYESIRVTLPNRYYDPRIGAALYDRYLAEWQVADEEASAFRTAMKSRQARRLESGWRRR